MGNLESIAEQLLAHGLAPSVPAAIVENGTRPSQRTLVTTLAALPADARRDGFAAPAIVIVGGVASLRNELAWFDRSPLFGKRVLVTRPAKQADALVRALYARGVEPILASTIAIVPPDNLTAAHRAVDEASSFGWIVFTSQNGVDAFFDRLSDVGADARALGGTKVAAIGAKTAERLRERGVRADLVPAEFISEEIGRALIEATRDRERILVYRAQEARDVLPDMLLDAGRTVTIVAAYKTIFEVDPDFAAKVKRADVLTFTSASTVRGFAELLGDETNLADAVRGKTIACIGPITTNAAEGLGLHVDVVADVYTIDGLLDALEARFALLA
jgi:uroporphyrinogen III methyltransferase/synthase